MPAGIGIGAGLSGFAEGFAKVYTAAKMKQNTDQLEHQRWIDEQLIKGALTDPESATANPHIMQEITARLGPAGAVFGEFLQHSASKKANEAAVREAILTGGEIPAKVQPGAAPSGEIPPGTPYARGTGGAPMSPAPGTPVAGVTPVSTKEAPAAAKPRRRGPPEGVTVRLPGGVSVTGQPTPEERAQRAGAAERERLKARLEPVGAQPGEAGAAAPTEGQSYLEAEAEARAKGTAQARLTGPPVPTPPAMAKDFAAVQSAVNMGGSIARSFRPEVLGPLAGRAATMKQFLGILGFDSRKFIADIDQFVNAYRLTVTGQQAGEKELTRIQKQLTNLNEPPEQFQATLASIMQRLAGDAKARAGVLRANNQIVPTIVIPNELLPLMGDVMGGGPATPLPGTIAPGAPTTPPTPARGPNFPTAAAAGTPPAPTDDPMKLLEQKYGLTPNAQAGAAQ